MNLELSELAIAILLIGGVILTALWNGRGAKLKVSPRSLELEIEPPPIEKVAEAGVEPARELPPTGF
jgi:hypothetical protein